MIKWEARRRLKAKEIVNLAKPYISGTWLELGAGTGNNTIPLGTKVDSLIGIDLQLVELIELKRKEPNIPILSADFRFLPIKANSVAGIFIAFSLHFVFDHSFVIKSAFHCLKPNGELIMVDYETKVSKPWIPHPIPKALAKRLLVETGFRKVSIHYETERFYIIKGKK